MSLQLRVQDFFFKKIQHNFRVNVRRTNLFDLLQLAIEFMFFVLVVNDLLI